MKNPKNKILNDIKNEFRNIKYILSITLIGSQTKTNILTNHEDLDLIIIIKKLTPKNYFEINNILNKIAKKYNNEKLYVGIENRRGEIKLKSKKEYNLSIQQLIYDIKTFKEFKKTDTFYLHECLSYKPLLGIELEKIISKPKLKLNNLISEIGGINFHIELIKNRNNTYAYYKIENEKIYTKIGKIKNTKNEEIELMCKGFSLIIMNIMKIISNKIPTTNFKEKISFISDFLKDKEIKLFLKELEKMKKAIRKNEKIKYDITLLRNNSLKYLTAIKEKIENL